MPFTTPEQFALLAALLLGGFLLGYAVAPNPKRWKRRVREQSASFTAYHDGAEKRLSEAARHAAALEAETDALRRQQTEAAQTIAALRAAVAAHESAPAAPLREAGSGVGQIIDTVPDSQLAAEIVPQAVTGDVPEPPLRSQSQTQSQSSIAPAPAPPGKGWFATVRRDDLSRLRGIDDVLNTRLFGLGVTRFEDLETLSAEDEMALEQRLSLPAGYIAREQWRPQAALLRAGQQDEHAAQFDAPNG